MSESKPSNPKDAVGIAKVPFSTVPANVTAEVGLAMLEGALKYARHNYRVVGVRGSVYYDAAMRHLTAWWEGQDIDPASELSHITKAIAGLMVLRDSMMRENWVDDRPPAVKHDWVGEMNAKAEALLAKYPNPPPACVNGGRRAGDPEIRQAELTPELPAFKPGDVVRCNDSTHAGHRLDAGKLYTVRATLTEHDGSAMVEFSEVTGRWLASRFKPIPYPQPLNAGSNPGAF